MAEKLTIDDYNKIPNPGSMTFRLKSARAVLNAQAYYYRVAKRNDDIITTTANTDANTLTITKKGKKR